MPRYLNECVVKAGILRAYFLSIKYNELMPWYEITGYEIKCI